MTLQQLQKVIEEELNPRLNFEGEEIQGFDYSEEKKTLFITLSISCTGICFGCSVRFTLYFIEYFLEDYFKEKVRVEIKS